MEKMKTICWRCNAPYTLVEPECPECGAANANINPEKAQEELEEIVAGARAC